MSNLVIRKYNFRNYCKQACMCNIGPICILYVYGESISQTICICLYTGVCILDYANGDHYK